MLTLTLVLSTAVFAVPAPRPEVVPCVMQRHVMVCPVDVGLSTPLAFVVDTGTRRTVIDTAVAARLGLSPRATSLIVLGADVSAGDVALRRLRFGSLAVYGVRASVVDLGGLEASTGVRAAGILGMDVLGRANLTIDYRRSRITIGVAEALSHRAPLVWTAADFAAVDVEIERRRFRLVVDTGADGILLFAGAGVSRLRNGQAVEAGGLMGTSRLSAVHVRQIRIASSRIHGRSLAVADATAARAAYDGDGLLGVQALDARVIALDFARGELRWGR